MDLPKSFDWQAPEYIHQPKTSNWYWSLGGAAAIFFLIALFLANFLFAIIVLLGTFTLILYSVRKPEMINYSLSPRGLKISNRLFPYDRLHSFWVHDDRHPHKIIIESERTFLPHLVIPLPENITNEQAREFLLQYLPEQRHEESVIDIIWEELGF